MLPDNSAPPRPAGARLSPLGLAFDLLLLTLIVIGIGFRFSWVNWSQDTDIHPDEYGLTRTLTELSVPDSLGDYINTRLSRLSPYQKYDIDGFAIAPSPEFPMPDNRMRWGQWPLVILRYAAELTGNTGYGDLRLMGRSMSAGADTLTLGVIFLIGWRLYGRRVGLMAAALSALAVMQIQQSHFMTADNFASLFTALAMYAAVRVAIHAPPETAESQEAGAPSGGSTLVWYALFGIFFGMALASRINLLPLCGLIGVAAFIAYAKTWETAGADSRRILVSAGLRLALAGVAAFMTFRVTQPMTFRAETGDTTLLTFNLNPEWLASMAVAQAESSGSGGGPPGEQWTNRPALVFPWINMVLWGMGLPLGLTAWAGFLWALWRSVRLHDTSSWWRHALPLTWAGGYFLFMGTRWVKSVRYFLPIYPFMALFAAWAVYELWRMAGDGRPRRVSPRALRITAGALGVFVLAGTLAWAWGFTSIYRNDNTRVQASRWIYQNVDAPFSLQLETGLGSHTEPLAAPHGLAIGTETPYLLPFTAQVTGTVTGLTLGKVRSPFDWSQPAVLHVVLSSSPGGEQVLAEGEIEIESGPDASHRVAAAFGPAALEQGETYYLILRTVSGGPVEVLRTVVSNENWDEGLPLRVDGRDGFGQYYRGLHMEVHWIDNEDKRQMYLNNLAQVDYIFVPSQRRLWAASRLPNNYPMTMEYYRALFDGRLGFELVAQFQSPIVIGPLQVSDLAGTWAWGGPPPVPPPRDTPFNFNILAAEEAFSVYDHAPVWIFRKTADFEIGRAAAILNAVDLNQVVNQGPQEATRVPLLLRLPPERLAEQRAGGTWSEMFDFDAPLNRYQFLGVAAWWLALVVMGWLAFPLTYAAMGGLADRGYPLAKTVALLFTTWVVWICGSLRLLPFTRTTILLGLLTLALISAVIYWRQRAEINAFIRAQRRHILIVEAAALALFVFMLLIRLGNPDLWHPWFGGEKPMVFSFFNAVLRSTSFPPYNPWLSGYTLNYYYYGFVIASVPTKLLGIVPAFAYNLILPMLFSLTGINAFCAAYNLALAGWRKSEAGSRTLEAGGLTPEAGSAEREVGSWKLDAGSLTQEAGSWKLDAGSLTPETGSSTPEARISMLAAGSSTLDAGSSTLETGNSTPDAGSSALDAGHWKLDAGSLTPETGSSTVEADASITNLQSPITNNQLPITNPQFPITSPRPYLAALTAALLIVVLGNLAQVHVVLDGFQRASDEAAVSNSILGQGALGRTVNGMWRVVTGQSDLPLATGHWYWNASRIVDDMCPGCENDGREITEFPFFTFLYADMHAHMLDMPFIVLSLGWAASMLLGARLRRPRLHWLAVWLVGGLTLGVPRATNTWDFPLFLALGVLGTAAGAWLADPRLTRGALFNVFFRSALVVGLAFVLYQPFDSWFTAAYSEVKLWEGTRTPVNAYLYVHGLFLFIIASFMAWETRRWLAETPASVMRRANEWLPLAALIGGGLVAGVLLMLSLGVPSAVIALPLMFWAGVLLLRSQDAMPVAKQAVLFMAGTALAVTLFVEFFALEADRMNTIFKFYIQVWVVFSVAAGAALAWVWADLPRWRPGWRGAWTAVLFALFAAAALYTLTASTAKMRDRFPARTALAAHGCAPIPGMPLPYESSLAPQDQPHSLYGLDYMTWGAYCDRDAFLPLVYDHDAIRFMQDNIPGSPVILEAQSRDLYRYTSRYAWNTGLPNVVGWDYHTRQHNAAINTEFVAQRVRDVENFYLTTSPDEALRIIQQYDVRYVVVGVLEQAFYSALGGLGKFDTLTARGDLTIIYTNPGVTLYEVAAPAASQ